MSIKAKSLQDLEEKFHDVIRKAGETDNTKIRFQEMFTESFMEEHTEFRSFEGLIDCSQWEVESKEDFKSIPEDEFGDFISEKTDFSNWREMMTEAAKLWMRREAQLEVS